MFITLTTNEGLIRLNPLYIAMIKPFSRERYTCVVYVALPGGEQTTLWSRETPDQIEAMIREMSDAYTDKQNEAQRELLQEARGIIRQ